MDYGVLKPSKNKNDNVVANPSYSYSGNSGPGPYLWESEDKEDYLYKNMKITETEPVINMAKDVYKRQLFTMIENSISLDLLARLYSSQLVTKGEKHLLDRDRYYYKILKQIVKKGQEKGELRSDKSANELTKIYALCERALLYDWSICNGEYSLKSYAREMMPMFLVK